MSAGTKGAKPFSCVTVPKRAGLWLKPKGERHVQARGHVRRIGSLMGMPYFSASFVILKVLARTLPPERGNHAEKQVSLLVMLSQSCSHFGSLKINETMV